ncbi:hypothetical protein GCM10017044_08620 [Kordiimonas sediminis]|uniref:Uncharacterized protein n=1 Tax=Kordiimonas sediminis TaxID=1735581 RepID=A0A919ANL4_9PROT|nr:hypothetical protein [Kordiimonas sediminis]GHF16588.1 hypothetical protein GCM10017044_08620 [Kordiimonas sediminis]
MTKYKPDAEDRREQRIRRLGFDDPMCVICGEDYVLCLEKHHVAGRKYDDTEVPVCCNCHRKLSDNQLDYPDSNPNQDRNLLTIGYFLMGLSDLFKLLAEKLMEFGNHLIVNAHSQEQIDE